MKGSAIFCTSRLSVQDRARWFAAFAEALLSKNKGWLRVVIDEAHVFMPKQGGKGGGAIPAALHAGNELVSQGRSLGLRIVLASQRSAKLHNDALTQCSCLVAMLLMAPHDRDAVKDWIEDQADPAKGKEIVASLANLKPGQAWVWAPRARMLDKIQFPMPKTFDSSAAPDDDAGDGPKLAPINLDALQGKLAVVEKERDDNDPKKLKEKIAAQAKQIAALERRDVSAAGAPGVTDSKGLKEAQAVAARAIAQASRSAERARRLVQEFTDKISPILSEMQSIKFDAPSHIGHIVVHTKAVSPQIERAVGNGSLDKPLQKIVDAIRWWNVLGVARPRQPQVSFVAGYSHKSGTWSTYLSKLRSAALIEGSAEISLTQEGLSLAHEPDAPPSGDQLRSIVLSKIDGPLSRILRPIIEVHPTAMRQAEVAELAGYSPNSGTWSTYLSKLRSLDMISGSGELRASDWLFP